MKSYLSCVLGPVAASLLAASAIGQARAAPLALVGGTVIDATGRSAIPDAVVVVDGGRIKAVGDRWSTRVPPGARVINLSGKYVIPGLMDANVHLFLDAEPSNLIKYAGRYEELILEADQIALKYGITTVFDTWGPAEPLKHVRDEVNAGRAVGARIYLAGNIVGFNGPLSHDFFLAPDGTSPEFVNRINDTWTRGTDESLTYLTPEQVGARATVYLKSTGVDFLKYASSGHVNEGFLSFSGDAQRSIVSAAHQLGLVASAHATSVESLRLAVEAGVELVQHCQATGPTPIPQSTLDLMERKHTACALMLGTKRHDAWALAHPIHPGRDTPEFEQAKELNTTRLLSSKIKILLTTDAGLYNDGEHMPVMAAILATPDLPTRLGEGHFLWLQAVAERGMPPMAALQAASKNIAEVYGKGSEIGTLEAGKRADIVVLDADPLLDPKNYRAIAMVMKDGEILDRAALPSKPIFFRNTP